MRPRTQDIGNNPELPGSRNTSLVCTSVDLTRRFALDGGIGGFALEGEKAGFAWEGEIGDVVYSTACPQYRLSREFYSTSSQGDRYSSDTQKVFVQAQNTSYI